jgi:flagellar biosynthetic protein FliP
MTDSTADLAPAPSTPARRSRSPRRRFALHVGEMLIAMFAGMLVLGGAIAGVLALAGTGLGDASAAVEASVMAFTMTVPMVWWMNHRGHPARRSVEMAGSMIVPTAVVIALHLVGAVSGHSVLMIQHVVMIPAMVGVMLWRYEHYAH